MRRRSKVDDNQAETVKLFKRLGASVLHLHMVGSGCPDICIGLNKINILVEIKDGKKVKSKRKLTQDEQKFINEWKGRVEIVETESDIIKLIGEIRNGYKARVEAEIPGKVDR